MTTSYTLIGLGGGYDPCIVNDSAEKSQRRDEHLVPVPETDTGREVENTKGREVTLSKELGKMAP